MSIDTDVTRGGDGGSTRAADVSTEPGMSNVHGATVRMLGGGRAADLLAKLASDYGKADVLAESRAVARRVARLGDR